MTAPPGPRAIHSSDGVGVLSWRGDAADDFTHFATDIAEAMRQLAGKVVGIPGTEQTGRATDGQLDAPADHHSALLAPVRQHFIADRGPGRIALVQDRQLPPAALGGHEALRNRLSTNLDQFLRAEEHLRGTG